MNVKNMSEEIGNLNRELETIQKKILRLKKYNIK